ncbi:MAG: NUDIX hydrolase [Thermoguttaceae bacterium]
MTEISNAVGTLDALISSASGGLREDVFLLVSRLLPLVNVDLLVQDESGRTLLTWRDDEFYGPGWHVPGGIIRFQEPLADRIRKTAKIELGTDVEFAPEPIAVRESIDPKRQSRGHFVSLLYRCTLLGPPAAELQYRKGVPAAGQWSWHAVCPPDMIDVHRHYAEFIDTVARNGACECQA